MTFDEVVDATKAMIYHNRIEQIEWDKTAIEREWVKEEPNLDVVLRLLGRIRYNEERL